jgi:hypothetical protein
MHLTARRTSEYVRADRPRRVPIPSGALADVTAAVLVAVGAVLVIWAYRKAPTEQIQSYDPIFWAGMVLAYLAIAWRAISGRRAVLWLGLLGLFAVLPKFWMSQNGPIYYDETSHYALLQAVISGHKLFQYTPTLPIGTYYPGLESAAAAIHWLTGLSAWDSALTLIAVVHCLIPVQIFYIARALPVSDRLAAAAALVYAVNPSFIYDDVQFAYESVAILLMLTIVRLAVEALAAERFGGRTWRQTLSTWLLIAVMSFGCVVTHHLTSLDGAVVLLVAALFLKPMSGFADLKGGGRRLFVRWTPVLTLAGCLALWIGFVAPETVPYLFPNVSKPVSEILSLVGLAKRSKTSGGLRAAFGGSAAPAYEQLAAYAAPFLIAVALLLAAILWLRKRPLRSNFLWPFVLTAAYLVSLPVTLTAAGAAGAHRSWPTTYIGVAVLPAALVVLFELERRKRWVKRAAVAAGAAALVVLLVGNVAAGEPIDYRFPGPYQFGSNTLSVTPETLHMAQWILVHLGPGAHVVTDEITGVPLTADADAYTPQQTPALPIGAIWYNKRPPYPALMRALQQQGDDYIVVDTRDAQYVAPQVELFFPGEPSVVPAANIARMAHWPWLHLLYSSQHYRVYKINFGSYYTWYRAQAKDH